MKIGPHPNPGLAYQAFLILKGLSRVNGPLEDLTGTEHA